MILLTTAHIPEELSSLHRGTLADGPLAALVLELEPRSQSYMHCWRFPQVRKFEADNFEGGLGNFCWFFFNFMFMIWDSRHEDLQLFWLNFKHWLHVPCSPESTLQTEYLTSCLEKSSTLTTRPQHLRLPRKPVLKSAPHTMWSRHYSSCIPIG